MNEKRIPQPISPSEDQPKPLNILPSIQEPTQEKKPKKWLVIGPVIITLTAVSIAVVFAYQNYQLRKQLPLSTSSPEITTPSPTVNILTPTIKGFSPTVALPTPTTALNIDDDWQTFEHDRLGYTFKYPLDFEQRGEEPFPGYLIEKLNTPPGSTVSIILDNTWNTECRNVGVDCSCATNPDSLKIYMEGFKKYPNPNIKYTGTITLKTATNTVEGVTQEVNTRGYGVNDVKYNTNSINFPMCINGQYYAIGFMAYKGYDLYDLSTKIMSTFRLTE